MKASVRWRLTFWNAVVFGALLAAFAGLVYALAHREAYRAVDRKLSACLDDVGAVGRYVELEILADESRYDAAREVLLKAVAEFGLTDPERRSYLRLLLEQGAMRTPAPKRN